MAGTKAQLEFTADASGVEAGVAKAKRSLADLGAAAVREGKKAGDGLAGIGDGSDKAAAKVEASTKNLIGSIQRTTAALEAGSRGSSKYFEAIANQRGVSVDALKPYLDQLDAVTARTKSAVVATQQLTTSLGATSFNKPLGNPTTSLGASGFGALATEAKTAGAVATEALQKVGVSAGQTRAALAQLPAQFSDIVVSLQGGQRPLSVLLQQGSQIKDSFGGVGPAIKGVVGAVSAMITPFTVAAGAVGALAVAMYQGSQESTAYAKALILTGNSIGKTTDQLKDMATAIAGTTGTQGDAAAALAAIAESGKVASGSLSDVGAAVVSMNRVLGTSIDDAVAVFAKLADEPAKASAKLNEQMHYLNLTTYERIRALEDQGKKEEAAALAQSTYATATTARLSQVENSTGVLAKAWRALSNDAKKAWDEMQGLGRAQTSGEALADAQKRLAYVQQNGGNQQPIKDQIASLNRKSFRDQENADQAGIKAAADAAQIASSDRIKKLSDEVQTNADKRRKALADLDRDFKTLGKATSGTEYDKLVSNINEKYKDPKAAGAKAFTDDAGTKMLETLRQQEASLKAQLDVDDKLTDSEKERAKFVQLISDLKTKGTLTADQKSLLANQASITAQLDLNVAVEKQLNLKKEAQKLDEKAKRDAEELARTFEGINISMASANESRQDQYDRTLATAGQGSRAREEIVAEIALRKEYERNVRQATKAAADKNLLGSDAYQEEVGKIKSSFDEALDLQRKFYASEKKQREDWTNGAKSALADYVDYVDDAAGRAKSLIQNSLGGLTDSITDALWSGNLDSFKKFGDAIGKQIVSGIVEQQITKPVAQWVQGAIADPDSMFSKLFGGLVSNKGTGEDWLGALGLGGKNAANDPLGGLAKPGSTPTNPLYVSSVDSLVNNATGSDGIGSLISKLGSSYSGGGGGGGDALGAFIALNGYADGGDPPVGRASIVGERGPEVFVPKQPGTVISNDTLRKLGGGGSSNVTINVPVTGSVDSRTRLQIANDISLQQRNARRYA